MASNALQLTTIHSTATNERREEYKKAVAKRSLIVAKTSVIKLVNVLYSSFYHLLTFSLESLEQS